MSKQLPMLDSMRVPSCNPDLIKGIENLKSPAAVIKRIVRNLEEQKVNCMESIWNALLINKRSLRHGELMVDYETSSREEVRGFWEGVEGNRPYHFWYYNGSRYFIVMESTICIGVTCSGREEAKDVASRLKDKGIKAKLDGSDKVTLYQYASKINFKDVDFSSPLLEMTKLSFKELGMDLMEQLQSYFNAVENVKYTRDSPILDQIGGEE